MWSEVSSNCRVLAIICFVKYSGHMHMFFTYVGALLNCIDIYSLLELLTRFLIVKP